MKPFIHDLTAALLFYAFLAIGCLASWAALGMIEWALGR